MNKGKIRKMKRVFLSLLATWMWLASQNAFCNQEFNFSKGENVGEESLLSPYKGETAICVRHDSTFIAELNEDGSIKTMTYTEEFSRIKPDGQVAYSDKSGTLYYSKAGKLFTAKRRKDGKWEEDKYIKIIGSEVERDKYPGSVLAYANWRYKPSDNTVILNPTINEDETEMYFASNMKDSKGLDIWKVKKDPNGEWGVPTQVGSDINSDADENYPYIREDGSLVFASNKKVGDKKLKKGKYNIYVADANKPTHTYAEENAKKDLERLAATTTEQEETKANDSLLAETPDKAVTEEKQSEETRPTEEEIHKQIMDEIARVNSLAQGNTAQKQTDDKSKGNPDAVIQLSENVQATHDMRIFYFKFDTDIPNGTYEKDLLVVLDFLKAYPDSKFQIVGHTDERGSDEYNDELSLKRAEWLRFNLLLKGVKMDRLEVRGDGKRHPIVKDAKTEADHQKNRRAEITKMN